MATTDSRSVQNRYRSADSRSAALHQRAVTVLPGGNTRTTVHLDPFPPYAQSGRGAVVVDAECQERLDFLNNYTSLMHGHADPDIIAAVTSQLENGTAFSMPTESEIGLAEIICERIPSVEQVRFTNSGTEAVMMAIQAARAYTDRPMIAKFEGSYHGTYDFAGVSTIMPRDTWTTGEPPAIPYAAGTPQGVLDNVRVLRYNDLDMAERVIERDGEKLAAVLVDPMPWRMGAILGKQEFLAGLRELCDAHGILLIFDEVISLRASWRGAQGLLGVMPDLTTMAKIIGGGFPVGAVGGRAEVMAVFDPRGGKSKVPHGGTFSANPVTMVAGRISMEKLSEGEAARLDALGAYIREGLAEALDGARVPGQVTGAGSAFGVHLNDRDLKDYQSWEGPPEEGALRMRVAEGVFSRGAVIAPALTGCLSTPMTEEEANVLLDAFSASLNEVFRT